MTTAEDYAILQEYQDWTESLATGVPDTSIEAFKRHREAEFNAARIRKALEVLAAAAERLDAIEHPDGLDFDAAMSALRDTLDALEGDLEFVEDRSLTNPCVRKVYA